MTNTGTWATAGQAICKVAQNAFAGRVLLVGINYDKKTKKHECRIERWKKTQVVA